MKFLAIPLTLAVLGSLAYGADRFDTSQLAQSLETMAKMLEASLPKKEDSMPVFDVVKDFGADHSGLQATTKQLQAAIDACAKKGSGTVYFPSGTYLTGTLVLKSGVHLELAGKTKILGSTDPNDYPVIKPKYESYANRHVVRSLFYAEQVDDVSIAGEGTIDFQGGSPVYPKNDNDPRRPNGIRIVSSTNIRVSGLLLINSAKWMQHYLDCENVMLDNVTVFNHAQRNNDGIDIDGCRNVYVRNCRVDSDDDAICLKSTGPRACENVLIENCIASSHCNALKLGTETIGGFKRILYRNCRVLQSATGRHHVNGTATTRTAITVIITDGGTMEDVWFDHIEATDCITPIFVTLGNRGRKVGEDASEPGIGRMKNIKFSNIKATGAGPMSSSITGLDREHPIQNVSLENIQLAFTSPGKDGDRKIDMVEVIKKMKADYPSPHKWGNLPSYGFYFRYLDGLNLTNVNLKLECSDPREAIITEDCADVVNHR